MTTIERVNLVAKTTVSIGAVLAMAAGLWAALNQGAQAAQKADVALLHVKDVQLEQRADATDGRIDRLISVVETNSELMVEPKGSPEYLAAVTKLRAMRRVVAN